MTPVTQSLNLRRFTIEGVEAMRDALQSMRIAEQVDLSKFEQLAGEDDLSESVGEIPVPRRAMFSSRFEMAEAVYGILSPLTSSQMFDEIEADQGIWTWLACLWAEELLRRKGSAYVLGASDRLILEPDNWKRYYRHLIAGPFFVYAAHAGAPEASRILLSGKLNSPGEFYEMTASRLSLVRSRRILELITHLYADDETGAPRRGAASKNAGSIRRLNLVLSQLSLTFDASSMEIEEIVKILPSEFHALGQR
jgi:hypothetical protein